MVVIDPPTARPSAHSDIGTASITVPGKNREFFHLSFWMSVMDVLTTLEVRNEVMTLDFIGCMVLKRKIYSTVDNFTIKESSL